MLTKEQQEQIVENKWIINTVAKRLGIDDEDIRNELMLFMCNTIEKYDPTKGVKLGTYLYRSVYLRALRLLKYDRRYKARYILADFITTKKKTQHDERYSILMQCIDTEQERQIIALSLKGFRRDEIATKLGIREYRVTEIKSQVIKRTREICDLSPKLPK